MKTTIKSASFSAAESGNVVVHLGIDLAGLRINREQDRAVEAVALRENLRHRGHGFLRAILLVAGDEDDALALAGTGAAFVGEPLILGGVGNGNAAKDDG